MPTPIRPLADQKMPPQELRVFWSGAALVGWLKRERHPRPLQAVPALALRQQLGLDLSTPFNCIGPDSGPEVSPYELRRRRAQEPSAKPVDYRDSEK